MKMINGALVTVWLAQAYSVPMGVAVAVGVALVALVAVGIWRLVGGRRTEIEVEEAPALPSADTPPSVDVLEERAEVEVPVEITEGMSLKEIKAAKRARLSRDYIESEASRAERERRKGKASGASPAVTDVPAPEPAAAEPAAAAAPISEPRLVKADELTPSRKSAQAAEPTESSLPGSDSWEDVVPTASLSRPAARVPVATPAAPAAPEAEAVVAAEPGPVAAEVAPEPTPPAAAPSTGVEPGVEPGAPPAAEAESARTLEDGLAKTRGGFIARLGSIFSSKPRLDGDVIDELEEVLFTADIGVKTSGRLLSAVQDRYAGGDFDEPAAVWDLLRRETAAILGTHHTGLDVDRSKKPFVLLMVGVNGAGKTTTIGKLAARFSDAGLRVMMVAGDTFRAAAVDQLVEWGDRVGCEVHRGKAEADPSSVIFDGVQRAESEGIDVVLCDTAGRLQTKTPLMDELAKIARVSAKALDGAPHETVLVIDANTGQNAIQQAKMFSDAVPLSGLILTKLDGTAKGGVVIGISEELKVPIYFVGIGEAVGDLRPFDPAEFIDALF